jgi:hypothetical protein
LHRIEAPVQEVHGASGGALVYKWLNTLRERVAHLREVRIVTTAPVLAVHLDRH